MNIVVTGGAGYLGSVLVPRLVGRGHSVRVVDLGYFGVGHLRTFRRPVDLVRQDIRRVRTDRKFADEVLDGADCLVHLPAGSNDPSAELNPELRDEVNFRATEAWPRPWPRRPGAAARASSSRPRARCTAPPTARWTSPERCSR
jgi:nucleoside-diphosphate-sugar epimerase